MSHGQHKDISLKKDHSPTRNKTKDKNIRVTGRLDEKELEEKGKKERKEGNWEGERERMKERGRGRERGWKESAVLEMYRKKEETGSLKVVSLLIPLTRE